MRGGSVVREARRRAGLTQAQLARRVGTTQSAIARIERGRTAPSLERLRELVRACGLDLELRLVPLDDSEWSVALTNLQLSVDERVRQHQAALRFARAGRAAARSSGRGRARAVAEPAFAPERILAVLREHGVRYVLVGGSPP